ncbi:MAG: DUF421 domain-containing protein [Fimbriimonas sp.]
METVVRVFVIYVAILAGMRMMGKREFGQLSPSEFVILLLIPEIVSTTLNQNDTSVTNALIGLATIMLLVFLTSMLTHRFKKVEKLISDSAAVLVLNGKPLQKTMTWERVNPEEVMTEARKSGIEEMSKIKYAVLEPDGKISIVPMEGEESSSPPDEGGLG